MREWGCDEEYDDEVQPLKIKRPHDTCKREAGVHAQLTKMLSLYDKLPTYSDAVRCRLCREFIENLDLSMAWRKRYFKQLGVIEHHAGVE